VAGKDRPSTAPGLWTVLRDILLLGFGVLIDRTVTYEYPSLAPFLSYLWLLAAIWLTREVIDKTPLRSFLIASYSRYGGKQKVLMLIVLFIIGGGLLCGYWWGINRFFRGEETFAVEVRSGFISDSGPLTAWMVSYPSMLGNTASPVFYLSYIRITNTQNFPRTISEFRVSAGKEPEGPFEDLVPIPLDTTQLTWCGAQQTQTQIVPKIMNMANGTSRLATRTEPENLRTGVVAIAYPMLEPQLRVPIQPHASIDGWLALDSLRHVGLSPGQIYFRISLKDSNGKGGQYVTQLPRLSPGANQADTGYGSIVIPGPVVDISSHRVKYYSDPFPRPDDIKK
jgi:hypothetical protein